MNEEEHISLRHLRILVLLLEVGSPTRVAQILNTTQPTVSKSLAKLRTHFGDPLFVRAGHGMQPTPKAIALCQPLKAILETTTTMRGSSSPFDSRASTREFSVIVTEVGMLHLLLPIIRHLEREGTNLRLKAVPLDSRQIEARLEAGEADIAIGAFPHAASTTRRQLLYTDSYLSVARGAHPRLNILTKTNVFMSERHVVVTSANRVPYAHRSLEQKLTSRLATDHIAACVPNFLMSAYIASETDAVGTMPAKLAEFLAEKFKLATFPTPLALPRIEISQFWHERVHNDQGHRWFRHAVYTLFAGKDGASRDRGARPMQAPRTSSRRGRT
jgi:DNA-binding transcriptional LysR family regulator